MSEIPPTHPAAGEMPSPVLLLNTINAFQTSAAIRAAIELDLFTAIAEGHVTAPALAAQCEAAERGVRILCDTLTVLGFLTKSAAGYGLTRDSAVFLDRRSHAYLGGVVEFMHSPAILNCFAHLTEAVRRGGTAASDEGTMEADHPVWVNFARAMMPMMAMPAKSIPDMSPFPPDAQLRVLDIAAGHGLFGLAFAERYPNVEVTAVDWAPVLEVARENALRAGVADRFRTIAGSAFEVELGTGYDVVLLTNFLHHFDAATCESLLRKIGAALADDGVVLTLEFVPNEDRVSPPMAAGFALVMLASTAHGDAYTGAELEAMFRNAGFSRNELHESPATVERVLVSRR